MKKKFNWSETGRKIVIQLAVSFSFYHYCINRVEKISHSLVVSFFVTKVTKYCARAGVFFRQISTFQLAIF